MNHNTGKDLNHKHHLGVAAATLGVLCGLLFMGEMDHQHSYVEDHAVTSTQLNASGVDMTEEHQAYTNTLNSGATIAQVASKVVPSVVSVKVRSDDGGKIGSGVIYDAEHGYIVTNAHVVDGASTQNGSVKVVFNDSTTMNAKIVKSDNTSDIAVLQLAGRKNGLAAIQFAKTPPQVGDTAIAVGSPLGLSETVTNGIVSAVNRPVEYAQEDSSGVSSVIASVQTNAAINPGNSGGALVNNNGELIGVNSSIATSGNSSSGNIGIGFAVPAATVQHIVSYLQQGKVFPYGTLGVRVSAGTAEVDGEGEMLGAQISDLDSTGAAASAGLKKGDTIIALNGEKTASQEALVGLVRQHAEGDEVKLNVVRDRTLMLIAVKLH